MGVQSQDTMRTALGKVLRFYFERMLQHEPGTRLGKDPEELHDMRVASRRLRSALRLFGSYLTGPYATSCAEGLRRLARVLGDVRDMDVAASVQQVVEEILLRIARHVHDQTGLENLCLAGGVALNCVANGRTLREGPFKQIWIQPAAGDAGGAVGTALFSWYQILDNPRTPGRPDGQHGSYLGPRYADGAIAQYLDGIGAVYRKFDSEEALAVARAPG